MANTFNTPNVVNVATDRNYIASNTLYDMLKPVIGSAEAKVWGSQDITGLINLLGGENYVSSSVWRHFEEDRIHGLVIGDTSDAPGASVAYTSTQSFTFPSSSNQYNPPYDNADAQTVYNVRKHDVLLVNNAGTSVQGWVSDVSGSTFTVKAMAGGTLPTGTGIVMINIGNAEPEVGGGMPTTINYRDKTYENVAMIQADKFQTTGVGLVEQTWIPFEFNGQTLNCWYLKGCSATYKRFRNFREIKGVVSEKSTNSGANPTSDETPTSTEGLIPFAKSYGNNTTYDIGTGLTLDRWNTLITDQVDKNKGATENSEWMGINVRAAIESFIRTEMKNGGVQYGAFQGDQKKAIDFGFDSFQTLGYTNHCMTYQLFNDPTLLGADGFGYKNLLVGIPMDKGIYKLGDQKESTEVPALRMNLLKLGGVNRGWEEFPLGGTGGVYTSGDDVKSINFRTNFGMEFFGSNRYFTVQGANL